jgi:hypothetical protein
MADTTTAQPLAPGAAAPASPSLPPYCHPMGFNQPCCPSYTLHCLLPRQNVPQAARASPDPAANAMCLCSGLHPVHITRSTTQAQLQPATNPWYTCGIILHTRVHCITCASKLAHEIACHLAQTSCTPAAESVMQQKHSRDAPPPLC